MAKDKNCSDCYFYKHTGTDWYCAYIFMTNSRRPCPPGAECTEKVPRKVKRRKKVKK